MRAFLKRRFEKDHCTRCVAKLSFAILLIIITFSFGCERVEVDKKELDLEAPYVPDLGLKPAKAEANAPKQEQTQTHTPATLLKNARSHIEKNEFAKAIPLLRRVLGGDNKHLTEEALFLLYTAHHKLGETKSANLAKHKLNTQFPDGKFTQKLNQP